MGGNVMRCQSEGGTGHQKSVEGWGEMGQANEEYLFLVQSGVTLR